MINILGFQFGRMPSPKTAEVKTFVDRENDDGSFTVVSSGSFAAVENKAQIEDGSGLTESELIDTYRSLAMLPEVDWAIEEIINEAVVFDRKRQPVKLNLDKVKLSANIKADILKEFDFVLHLLDFRARGPRIMRRWYIDGRIYYHALIDENDTKSGIKEVRYVDPKRMRKIREVRKNNITSGTITVRKEDITDYYLYVDMGADSKTGLSAVTPATGIKVTKDSIATSNSGIMDRKNTMVLSYLHKAIRVANQLSMLESAIVIYRLSRAPERRAFYVDVGNLPPARIEQYMNYIMNKYKTKISYDSATGGIKDSKRYLSLNEDFWMPRREGSRGTEIVPLPGGQNLGELSDVNYFLKKLFQALNVPYSRVSGESNFGFGKATEISRDEARFSKFVSKIRNDFAGLFEDLLGKQLVLKEVMTLEEWATLKHDIYFEFNSDNYFNEMLETSLQLERYNTLNTVRDFIGSFLSKETVYKNIFRLNDQEINEEKERLRAEKASSPPPEPSSEGGKPMGEALEVEDDFLIDDVETTSPAEVKLTESLTNFIDGLSNEKPS